MVQINFAAREINCKIVFYGPGRSGKTTNLEVVHARIPPDSKGELVSIATETDRTLYFDFLPLDLGKIGGMTTKFQLYTVPGQVFYNATRKLVLQGADGIVFVADSNPEMRDENIESLENLAENLKDNGIDINDTPIVFQWNKRDLPEVMPSQQMQADLNHWNAPTREAIAVKGEGVILTLSTVSKLVMAKLDQGQGAPPARPAAAPAHAPARPAVPGPAAAPVPLQAPVPSPPPAAARPPGSPAPQPQPMPMPQARPPVPPQRAPGPMPAAPPRPPGPPMADPPPRPMAGAAPGRPMPQPIPRPMAGAAPGRPMPQPIPRAAPMPPAPAAAGRAAPVPRRSNPLADEIRRRKEMEARRVSAASPQPQKVMAKPIRRKGGATVPLVVGAIIGVLLIVGLFLYAMGFLSGG